MYPLTKFGIPTSKNIGDMDRTRKRDGRTDGRTVRLLYASQSSFGGIIYTIVAAEHIERVRAIRNMGSPRLLHPTFGYNLIDIY